MKLYLDENTYIETNEPIDISLPLSNDNLNPIAWYVKPPRFTPVRTEHYVGAVSEGGSVNFRDIYFNPHGHGTHTECLGHITKEVYSINKVIGNFFFTAQLISIEPQELIIDNNTSDFVILADQLKDVSNDVESLVIRTLPNNNNKRHKNYSSTNPPYLDVKCVEVLLKKGIKHLLIDLPSVDREMDNGELAFHHAFWEVPMSPNFERTITELIFVDNKIDDGHYILNLQVAPFENDAAPSRPVLYRYKKKKS
jgi:arylformamidase